MDETWAPDSKLFKRKAEGWHSFSKIDTFMDCERRYFLDNVTEREPSSPAARKGQQVHATLERVARKVKMGMRWSNALRGVLSHPPDGPYTQPELAAYLKRASVLEGLAPVEIEKYFKIPEWKVRGYIDMISNTMPMTGHGGVISDTYIPEKCVIDYKTIGAARYIKTPYEARRSLQLQIYALAADVTTAGFIYFPPRSEILGVFVTFSKEELEIARKRLVQEVEVMRRRWYDMLEGHEWEQVWSLSRPDNFLCSPNFCRHWEVCFGDQESTG